MDNLFFWYTNGMYNTNADTISANAMRNCGLGSWIMGVMNSTTDTMNTNIGITIGTYSNGTRIK